MIITDKAAQEMKRVIAEQSNEISDKLYLRVRCVGGGCSGFQTKIDIVADYNKDKDTLYEINGIDVVIDNRSKLYVEDTTINFIHDLNKRGFSITVHGAKNVCGCGSSFSM